MVKEKWINELRALNLRPVLKILEEVSHREGSSAEIRWIVRFLDEGADLVNFLKKMPKLQHARKAACIEADDAARAAIAADNARKL
jgi:hypothetical protein